MDTLSDTSHRAPSAATATTPTSRIQLWAGRTLTAIPALFMLMDGVGKILRPPAVLEPSLAMGFNAQDVLTLGIIQLACVAFFLVPRTAALGGILLTAYLGGAISIHVKLHNPLFTHILFPVYLGVMVWGGLYMRDSRVRALIPFRSNS